MPVFLFDIDHTLLDAVGAGRDALTRAFHHSFGIEHAFDGVAFQGRTDAELVRDALARYGITDVQPADEDRFVDCYVDDLGRTLADRDARVLPGVRALLEALVAIPGVAVGVATGNYRRGALVKLGHLGLLDIVHDGGFGDDHLDRADVIAAGAAVFGRTAVATPDDPVDVVVIGDTPLDVAGALANGFRAVGVGTGFVTTEELEHAGASLVLPDLSDTPAVVDAFLRLAGSDAAPPPRAAGEHAPDVPPDAGPGAGREVEAKFAVADAATIETFLARETLGDCRLGPVRTVKLGDTYFDTADRALLRRGLSLRGRVTDVTTRVTVKGLKRMGTGAVHSRIEHEATFGPEQIMADVDPFDPVSWPEEMRSPVIAATGPEPEFEALSIVAHLRHLRDVLAAPADAGEGGPGDGPAPRVIGELAVEHVAVLRPPVDDGGPWRPPEVVTEFAELELELATAGTAAELDSLAEWLGEQQGLRAQEKSKFERALRALAVHPPAYAAGTEGVQPDMPMTEAGRLIWRRELTEILLSEAGARLGDDIEFVHDMRVATRRARASATLFSAWFEPKAIEPHRRALRKTGRRLGAVRDLDVALAKLRKYASGLPAEDQQALRALDDHWRRARRDAYVRLLDWMDSGDYRRFVTKLSRFCVTPGAGALHAAAGAAVAPAQVRHVMPMAIFDRFAAVRAYETVLDGDAAATVPETTLHALRIECKYLRYALEMVRTLLGADGDEVISQLKRLQDHLGDLNDAVVARDTLRQVRREGLDTDAVSDYVAVQEETIQRLRDTFPQVWERFLGQDNREVLLRALARL